MTFIHLDPVGGLAGDMFAAALLDAAPEGCFEALRQALAEAGLASTLALELSRARDGAISGLRFDVREAAAAGGHRHPHGHGHRHGHPHRAWREIRAFIGGCALAAPVRERALDIFARLAEAEARVHGIAPAEVEFHEVGAWDSLADVLSAAWLIERLGVSGCSCAPLPAGRGLVRCAHGLLPLPAPATALLLEGMPVFDDGLEGERVTPTGAAILCHLAPRFGPRPGGARRVLASGIGLGTRPLAGLSNMLRVLLLEADPAPGPESGGALVREQLIECRFEVDDQSPEDLAVGLARVRALGGVLELAQGVVYAKKNRLSTQVQVLARAEALDTLIEACLTETTTLGVRWSPVGRVSVARREGRYAPGGDDPGVRVKRAWRPGGVVTAKAEMDDLSGIAGGHAGRQAHRRRAEQGALDADEETEH